MKSESGLTFKQEKAAWLIATGGSVSNKKLAEKLGVEPTTVRDWKKDLHFKVRVMQIFEEEMIVEKAIRVRKINKVLEPINREIAKRLKKDKNYLADMSIKDLINLMLRLHGDIRQDMQIKSGFLKPIEAPGADDGGDVSELDKARQSYLETRKRESGKVVEFNKAR